MTLSHREMLRPEMTAGVIGAFYDVYNRLGFGYLESVYAAALVLELRDRGYEVRREVAVDVLYKGQAIGHYRVDVLVEDAVLVEVKAARLLDAHAERQVLNYLRATRLELGLLLHFGPRPSFRRFVATNKAPL